MKASLVFKKKKKKFLLLVGEKKKRIQIRETNFIPPGTAAGEWLTNFQLQSYILSPVKQRNLTEMYRPDPLKCSGCFACFSNAKQLQIQFNLLVSVSFTVPD